MDTFSLIDAEGPLQAYHYIIMARITLEIDNVLLAEIRFLQRREGTSMGKIVSRLLAEALARRKPRPATSGLVWVSQPMKALVDVADKDALYAVLDEDET